MPFQHGRALETRQVRRGTLVTPLTLAGTVTTAPNDHIAYFIGSAPCTWQGNVMTALAHSGPNELAPGLRVDRSFSNKPTTPFRDHEQKLDVNDEQQFREQKDSFVSPYGFGVNIRGGMGAETILDLRTLIHI